jgi:hypothetical protein
MPNPEDADSVKTLLRSIAGAAAATPDLIHQAELQLINQLADQVGKCATAIQDMRKDHATSRELDRLGMQEIRERLIRIEENRIGEDLKMLELRVTAQGNRIDALEADKDRRDGATSLLNWFLKNWPALVAMVLLAAVVLKANGKL